MPDLTLGTVLRAITRRLGETLVRTAALEFCGAVRQGLKMLWIELAGDGGAKMVVH
jgi:hypothetical protein